MVLSHTDTDWRKFGACRGNSHATDLMFEHICTHRCSKSNGAACMRHVSVVESKAMCDSCPVMDRCRWWAVVTNLNYGVAGGLTFAERLVVRKRLRKDPIGNALLNGEVELECL